MCHNWHTALYSLAYFYSFHSQDVLESSPSLFQPSAEQNCHQPQYMLIQWDLFFDVKKGSKGSLLNLSPKKGLAIFRVSNLAIRLWQPLSFFAHIEENRKNFVQKLLLT